MNLISESQILQYRELGYFVTDVMFSEEDLAQAQREFDRIHREQVEAAEAMGDAKTIELMRLRPFIGQAHTRSSFLAEWVVAPIYLEACARLIGPDADLYYNQCVIKPPEKGKSFDWHQDSGYHQTKPLEYITCWTAISRTFVDNGCIWVLPKSHRFGLIDHKWNPQNNSFIPSAFDESEAIPVEMKAGQVAIFSSLLLHKSGPNISKETRYGYVPQYHVPQALSVKDGKPWGDLYPVLRTGKPMAQAGSPVLHRPVNA